MALCEALRSRWYLDKGEIEAVLADRDFFQPYLREALAKRANLGTASESPIDATDCQAVFFLTQFHDSSIIPDLLDCLRMNENDLHLLYSDSLTEHFWLPFAALGCNYLDQLWEFITDSSTDLYARHAVVSGVVAMHHFFPEIRQATVSFIERLLSRDDCFPMDHLAGILCDCGDSGLIELEDRALELAAELEDEESGWGAMATANDIRETFRNGRREDFISGRAHDVFGVNRRWEICTTQWEKERGAREKHLNNNNQQMNLFDARAANPALNKVGRNEPCPCGSGKKYKKCHGR